MLIKLPGSLVSRLDFSAATLDEIADPIDALPSRVVEEALEAHTEDYVALVEAKCISGLEVEVQETVQMPKAGHVGRYRTITTLPIRERVVLRALCNEVVLDVPPFDRSPEASALFQRSPLAAALPYVVIADVASFYFNVSHAALASRIVDATARVDTAQAVVALLGAVVGRDRGLPQNFGPSEVLSELIIAPVERRMQRAGVVTYRNNDDFRLCLGSWGEALAALEMLQQELNQLQLDLNVEKSSILRLQTYERNLNRTGEYLDEMLADVLGADIDYPQIDPYTGEIIEEQDEEDDQEEDTQDEDEDVGGETVQQEDGSQELTDEEVAAVWSAVLEDVVERRQDRKPLDGFEETAYRQATSRAIAGLTRLRSDAGLDAASQLVAIDPMLARQYSAYLGSVPARRTAISGRIDGVCKRFRGHVPPWVLAWLANPLLQPPNKLTVRSRKTLQDFAGSRAPSTLRARALAALAVHGECSTESLLAQLNDASDATKPELVAALAALPETTDAVSASAAIDNDRLLRWVLEHATSAGVS